MSVCLREWKREKNLKLKLNFFGDKGKNRRRALLLFCHETDLWDIENDVLHSISNLFKFHIKIFLF